MIPKMLLCVLASGSKGNAAIVEGPGGSVLVDCGVSRRELMRRAAAAGCNLDALAAVIVTHEHSDHVGGLPVWASGFDGPIFATTGTATGRKTLAGVPFELVGHSDRLEVAGMSVQLFPTSHDVADPVGMRFSVLDDAGEELDALGWCTDTGYLTAEALGALRGARILGIEANHDLDMLAHGPYPAFLRSRVGGDRGHLSNAQCAEALPLLVGEDTETVVALHMSQKNNTPGACIRALASALGAEVLDEREEGSLADARTPDGLLSICVASQDTPLTVR